MAVRAPSKRPLCRADRYPVIDAPSYVLGGRAMAIVYDRPSLERYVYSAVEVTEDSPLLIDRFLEDAFEMDVDCVCDGRRAHRGHHGTDRAHRRTPGDSACVIPTIMVSEEALSHSVILRAGWRWPQHRGPAHIQYAMRDGVVYVIEANPRASRTVPYVSKATGVPWVKVACQVLAGHTLSELGVPDEPRLRGHFVKEVVLPFAKFPDEPAILGPEMRSTGEVMGMDDSFGMAFAKAQMAGGNDLPLSGSVFVSVNDRDKANLAPIARELYDLGFHLLATRGTAAYLRERGMQVQTVLKAWEGRPNVVDHVINGDVDLMINTPLGGRSFDDERRLRQAAISHGVPVVTTLSAARAAAQAIAARLGGTRRQEPAGILSSRG